MSASVQVASATLTPAAKAKLAPTICALRTRLLADLHDAAESAYRLSVPIERAGLAEAERVRRGRLVKALDDPDLESAWTDDTTLGWVYQYWNDPEREALDRKIAEGGKVAPHEIAAKTQMFTERYMVEWLLQNSLGLLWLSMCKKNGWRADAEVVLPALESRRAEWRGKRERGEVARGRVTPDEVERLLAAKGGASNRPTRGSPSGPPSRAAGAMPCSSRRLRRRCSRA